MAAEALLVALLCEPIWMRDILASICSRKFAFSAEVQSRLLDSSQCMTLLNFDFLSTHVFMMQTAKWPRLDAFRGNIQIANPKQRPIPLHHGLTTTFPTGQHLIELRIVSVMNMSKQEPCHHKLIGTTATQFRIGSSFNALSHAARLAKDSGSLPLLGEYVLSCQMLQSTAQSRQTWCARVFLLRHISSTRMRSPLLGPLHQSDWKLLR